MSTPAKSDFSKALTFAAGLAGATIKPSWRGEWHVSMASQCPHSMDGIDVSNTDDGTRGEVGVLVSIKDVAPSSVRLTFDRVRRTGTQWEQVGFSTFRDLPKDTMLQMSMPEDDLHSFGLVLAAELTALFESKRR